MLIKTGLSRIIKFNSYYKNTNLFRSVPYKFFLKKTKPSYWLSKRPYALLSHIVDFNRDKVNFKIQSHLRSYYIRSYRFAKLILLYPEVTLQPFYDFYFLRLSSILSLLFSYNSLFLQIFYEKFFILRNYKHSNSPSLFKLIISFSKQKSFFLMQDFKANNLFYFSSGSMIKFFEKKKSLRKTKIIKILLMRYLRKLFLISNLKRFYLVVKGSPIFLNEMLSSLNQRLDHKFWDPSEERFIDESHFKSFLRVIKISHFFFYKNKSFVPIKIKKKGRIKRKLLRKLVANNRVVD